MNGCEIIIDEDAERIAQFLLPPYLIKLKFKISKLKMLQM
jgi:hypothetical protein